eukprot:m.175672 g.175672  ORF g.175672 m.175672 type:complete len:324 (-) comp14617_c0_seq4:347-1318(-)
MDTCMLYCLLYTSAYESTAHTCVCESALPSFMSLSCYAPSHSIDDSTPTGFSRRAEMAIALVLVQKRSGIVVALLESPNLDSTLWLLSVFPVALAAAIQLWWLVFPSTSWPGVRHGASRVSPLPFASRGPTLDDTLVNSINTATTVLSLCWSWSRRLAPVHLVAIQIQIISSKLHDAQASKQHHAYLPALTAVLSDLVACHQTLAPYSIWHETPSALHTFPALSLEMKPLCERLVERDLDYLTVKHTRPLKQLGLNAIAVVAFMSLLKSVRAKHELAAARQAGGSLLSLASTLDATPTSQNVARTLALQSGSDEGDLLAESTM